DPLRRSPGSLPTRRMVSASCNAGLLAVSRRLVDASRLLGVGDQRGEDRGILRMSLQRLLEDLDRLLRMAGIVQRDAVDVAIACIARITARRGAERYDGLFVSARARECESEGVLRRRRVANGRRRGLQHRD